MEFTSKRYPSTPFQLGRVNAILGANGAGKSQVLREIKQFATKDAPGSVVFIEGGRTIQIADAITLDVKTYSRYDKLESAASYYSRKRSESLADRIFDLIIVLEKKDQQLKGEHSDAVTEWVRSGSNGNPPVRAPTPMARLFGLFSEIFPQLALSFDHPGRRLWVKKDGEDYGPSSLSDGEKQVFSILADLIELEDKHTLIVADEPELNLHPELAERLWTLIEGEFPTRTFIYATHNISFALRSGVDAVFVLSSATNSVSRFTDLRSLPNRDASALLGALPGILSANRVVVTEGYEKSFDVLFYRWLLADEKLEVYAAGGCEDVDQVATKTGLWDRISSRVSICGVIDRDFRTDDELVDRADGPVLCLELQEAESYLCLPDVAVAVARRIGSLETLLEARDVENLVFIEMAERRLAIAARRVMRRARISLGVSIGRRALSEVRDEADLISQLRCAAGKEIDKAESNVGPDSVENLVMEELSRIDRILENRDLGAALQLLPGKELIALIAPKVGCRNAGDYMRALRTNFGAHEFPVTRRLADALGAKCLNLAAEVSLESASLL